MVGLRGPKMDTSRMLTEMKFIIDENDDPALVAMVKPWYELMKKFQLIEWKSIEEAPEESGIGLFLWSKEFVDLDFNPTGVVDGYRDPEAGWVIWQWDGCNDCYSTVVGEPTHFAFKQGPEV